GAGRVLMLRPDAEPRTVIDGNGGGQASASLPGDPEAVRWARFETVPGGLVLVCTASTVPMPIGNSFQRDVLTGWRNQPPHLSQFLAHLNYADQFCTGDRSAIALWEVKRSTASSRKGR